MRKGMRCFIAIDINEKVKTAILELQRIFKGCNADIRWIKPENIHLTLKFLGNVEEDMLDKIRTKLEDICLRYKGFGLEAKGIGLFPDKRRPRVIWVDVNGNGNLRGLQSDIEGAMATMGFKKEERAFTPHLTIGRFRSRTGIDALYDKMQLYRDESFGVIDVRSVLLMESRLRPAGAEYRRVAEFALKV
jgi:2'-5' RNA ligase